MCDQLHVILAHQLVLRSIQLDYLQLISHSQNNVK